jgi:hypothetical protein
VAIAAASTHAFAQGAPPETSKAAAAAPAADAPDLKTAANYTAFHSFEVRQATLLQSMIKEGLNLGAERTRAVDRVFAEFVRATMENKPRPILLAYTAQPVTSTDGEVFEPEGDTAKEFADGKIEPGRSKLVDLVAEQIHPSQLGNFYTIVRRWDKIRPAVADGPFRRLWRAISDPNLPLSDAERTRLLSMMEKAFKALPPEEQKRGAAGKHEPAVRAQILGELPENLADRVQQTIAWMEADHKTWTQPGQAFNVYEAAVKLLESQKAAEADAAEPEAKGGRPSSPSEPTPK